MDMTTTTFEAATCLAMPEQTAFEDWLAIGRNLVGQKRHIDWLIGDWITFGRQHFPTQIELALEEISTSARDVRRIEKTAAAFPPSTRCTALSFDHHAHVADIPLQEAMPLLKQAERQNIDARRFRIDAMLHKLEHGHILPRETDTDDDFLMAMVRAWNRASRSAREDFAEMAAQSHLGLIEFTA